MSEYKLSKFTDKFMSLDDKQRMILLSYAFNNVTVQMRELYIGDPAYDELLKKFKGLNEILHRFSSQNGKILAKDSTRYPDDVFWKLICETAEEYELEHNFMKAIAEAYSLVDSINQ